LLYYSVYTSHNMRCQHASELPYALHMCKVSVGRFLLHCSDDASVGGGGGFIVVRGMPLWNYFNGTSRSNDLCLHA